MAFTQASDWAVGSYVTNGTTITGVLPSSHASGDRLFAFVLLEAFGGRDTNTTITPPPDWDTWRDDQDGASDVERGALFAKIHDGSETDLDFTTSDAVNGIVWTFWIRDNTGQVDLDVAGATDAANSDTRTAPGITVTAGSRTFGWWQNGDGLGTAAGGDVPTSWTAFATDDEYTGTGYRDGLSGATGNLTPVNDPMAGSTNWVALLWAVKVTAAGGDPEGSLTRGKLIRGGLLRGGVLVG